MKLRLVPVVGLLVGLAACSSSSSPSPSAGGHKTLVIGMINPFSGANAAFGVDMNAGCVAAVQLINAQGGVMGNHLTCLPIDSRGDAADAVPALARALATHSNMVGVIGPGTDSATANMPQLEAATIPTMGANGDVSFDRSTYRYYWRITPSDDANAVAMAVAARNLGYTRAAMIFGTDPGAQTNVPALLRSFPKVGGTIVANESLQPDQSSYQTEVAKVVAAKPQVIFTELDPQTAATVFGELKQLGGLVPIIGTEPTIIPTWYQAVRGALGASDLQKYYEGVEQYAPTSGPAWTVFDRALLAARGVTDPAQYSSSPYTESYYDSVNLLLLAMIEAKTTSGPGYNGAIQTVTASNPSATVVHTFQEGAQALQSGKHIRYEGAVGPIDFDKWHNSSGLFAAVKFTHAGAASSPLTFITPAEVSKAS